MGLAVFIPHGGLGTFRKFVSKWTDFRASPSHAVGFKPYKLVKGLVETLLRESPSHTVGLELDDGRAKPEEYLRLSPSHTVGSELGELELIATIKEVAIPHGGLGTLNDHIKQNKTYQSFCQGGTLFK